MYCPHWETTTPSNTSRPQQPHTDDIAIPLSSLILGSCNYTEVKVSVRFYVEVKRGAYTPPSIGSNGPQHLSPLL